MGLTIAVVNNIAQLLVSNNIAQLPGLDWESDQKERVTRKK